MTFEPLQPATIKPPSAESLEGNVRAWMKGTGCDWATAMDAVRVSFDKDSRGACWLNSTYQVLVADIETPFLFPPMVWLSIKRIDKEPIHDWRDLQAIKNQLVGPECEGVELYPAEARAVDTANQYHLWVFKEPGPAFPFGFSEGLRLDRDDTDTSGAKQRPFEKGA